MAYGRRAWCSLPALLCSAIGVCALSEGQFDSHPLFGLTISIKSIWQARPLEHCCFHCHILKPLAHGLSMLALFKKRLCVKVRVTRAHDVAHSSLPNTSPNADV